MKNQISCFSPYPSRHTNKCYCRNILDFNLRNVPIRVDDVDVALDLHGGVGGHAGVSVTARVRSRHHSQMTVRCLKHEKNYE